MTKGAQKSQTDAAAQRALRPLPVHMALAQGAYVKQLQHQDNGRALVENMLRGIKLYLDHPFARAVDPLPEIWRAGEVRLLHVAADAPRAAAVIVPSLINRSSILDLLPDKSFVRYLAGRGLDVYLLDWGTPAADDGMATLADALQTRLLPALRVAQERAGGLPLYGIGYCMGGTLLAGALAAGDVRLDGAAFLASPWDFHAGDRKLTQQVQAGTPAALNMMATRDVLPMDWIQSVFATVNEERTVEKFVRFAAMDQDSRAARIFVAVEDWLNDGLDLPAALARTCIRDWYGENMPGTGQWVDVARIDTPALVMTPVRDRLVPTDSALALARQLPDATVMHPDCGHVGMMSGRQAEDMVWRPVADWLLSTINPAR